MQAIGNGRAEKVVRVRWKVAGMATGASYWIRWPGWANYATIAWGHNGTAVGTKAIHVSEHGNEAISTYDPHDIQPDTHPAGSTGHITIAGLERLASYIRLYFTNSSGSGQPTDDSEVVGRPATITFYRG